MPEVSSSLSKLRSVCFRLGPLPNMKHRVPRWRSLKVLIARMLERRCGLPMAASRWRARLYHHQYGPVISRHTGPGTWRVRGERGGGGGGGWWVWVVGGVVWSAVGGV